MKRRFGASIILLFILSACGHCMPTESTFKNMDKTPPSKALENNLSEFLKYNPGAENGDNRRNWRFVMKTKANIEIAKAFESVVYGTADGRADALKRLEKFACHKKEYSDAEDECGDPLHTETEYLYAKTLLAYLYSKGIFVAKDLDKAAAIIESSDRKYRNMLAELIEPFYANSPSCMKEIGSGALPYSHAEDATELLKIIEKSAEIFEVKSGHDADIFSELAKAYLFANSKNISKCVELHKKAALLGGRKGYKIATRYLRCRREYKELFDFTKNCAESGNEYAISDIGMMYFYGIGTERDFEKAYAAFQKGLDFKESAARSKMMSAYCLRKGLGVEKNENEAARIENEVSQSASLTNNPGSYFYHGRMFEGLPTPTDWKVALIYLEKYMAQAPGDTETAEMAATIKEAETPPEEYEINLESDTLDMLSARYKDLSEKNKAEADIMLLADFSF